MSNVSKHGEGLAPPFILGPRGSRSRFVETPETLSPEASAKKAEIESYIERTSAPAFTALATLWKHYRILNFGEIHMSRIRSGIVPVLVRLLAEHATRSDVFALEAPVMLQKDIDTWLDGDPAKAAAAIIRLEQDHFTKPFIDIIRLAKNKEFGVVAIDHRPPKVRTGDRKVNEAFVDTVNNRYGSDVSAKGRVIFYTGAAHALHTKNRYSVGDILAESVGKGQILTIFLQTEGWLLVTSGGDSFNLRDVLDKKKGRAIYLHHAGSPFGEVFSFSEQIPISRQCDMVIYY